MKLADEIEERIEAELEKPLITAPSSELGKAHRITDAAGRYIEFCKSTIGTGSHLKGLKVVVDCAHGATYDIAPNVFEELEAEVIVIGATPNGLNINDKCGTTELKALQAEVLAQQADLGIAFDGDGDRVIMVDHFGEIVDGDELLFIIARERQRKNGLKGGVVGTHMSNLGLEHALRTLGLDFKRAKVGDRYILEMLQSAGWTLGGESSGHIACLDITTTGDGIVSALQVLETMVSTGQSLLALKAGIRKYPQRLINVRMEQRVDLARLEPIKDAVKQVEGELGENGRVLLRPSGTEPVVRIMVEGIDPDQVERLAGELATTVENTLKSAA
jgi:phosphoglucosamine mutase